MTSSQHSRGKKTLKCLAQVQKLLEMKSMRQNPTVLQLQKAAGSLNFICQVLPAGCPFLMRLYTLIHANAQPEHRICKGDHHNLMALCMQDLKVFEAFLQETPPQGERVRQIPFLHKLQLTIAEHQVFANAARVAHCSFGCVWQNCYAFGMW